MTGEAPPRHDHAFCFAIGCNFHRVLLETYRVVPSHVSYANEIMRENSQRKSAAGARVSHLPRNGDFVYGPSREAGRLLTSFPGFVLFPRLPLSVARSRWQRCQQTARKNGWSLVRAMYGCT